MVLCHCLALIPATGCGVRVGVVAYSNPEKFKCLDLLNEYKLAMGFCDVKFENDFSLWQNNFRRHVTPGSLVTRQEKEDLFRQ